MLCRICFPPSPPEVNEDIQLLKIAQNPIVCSRYTVCLISFAIFSIVWERFSRKAISIFRKLIIQNGRHMPFFFTKFIQKVLKIVIFMYCYFQKRQLSAIMNWLVAWIWKDSICRLSDWTWPKSVKCFMRYWHFCKTGLVNRKFLLWPYSVTDVF